MISTLLLVALSQTPQHWLFRQPNLPTASYAFLEFAPASGAGMGAPCACTTPTGARGETLTFTRGSSATCTKTATGGLATTGIANGDLVTCSTNQPRVEYDSAGTLGLLVESARTNSTIRSEELDNAAWATSSTTVAAPTLLGTTGVAPDGASTAESFSLPATATGESTFVYQTAACPVAADTFTIYVKGVSGSGTTDVCINKTAGVSLTCASCAFVSTGWSRCSVSATVMGGGRIYIGNMTEFNGGTARSAQSIYAWGAQCEAGTYATSYMATGAASANRLAEAATLPLADGMALGSMAVSVNGGSGLSASGATVTVYIDGANLWELYHTSGQAYAFTYVGGVVDTVANLGALTANTTNRVAQYRSAVPELCGIVNGAAPVCNGVGVGATITTSGGTGRVYPGNYNATSNQIDAIVSRICVDPSPTRCR